MKTIKIDRSSDFTYYVTKNFTCQSISSGVTNLQNNLTISDSFVSNNYELFSNQIKEIKVAWQDNNNNVFIYETNNKLWKLNNSTDTLSVINNNFTAVIDNLHTLSDQVTAKKIKYSTYNNCFYISCQLNNDNSDLLRVLTLTGNDYSTINQGSTIDGWFSRGSSDNYEFTYDGPYCVVAQSYVNDYSSLRYNPRFILHISNDNRASWTSVTKQTTDRDDFGADVSINSYNGTYYLFDYKGWYFNQTAPTYVVTNNPSNLNNYRTSGVIPSTYTVTTRKEGNYIFLSSGDFSTDMTTFIDNGITLQYCPGSNKFYTFVSSQDSSTYFSPIREYSINNSTVTQVRECTPENGAKKFVLRKGDTSFTSATCFFTNNYLYQLNTQGLVRCRINNLVTAS